MKASLQIFLILSAAVAVSSALVLISERAREPRAAGPPPIYASREPLSTYYEYATTVVNGTATNSTDNLDADDDVYYAVNCGAAIYGVNVEHTSGQVTEPIAGITQIFFEDNFKFNATVTAYLEWFNWTANAWVNIHSGMVGSTEVIWNKTWASGFGDVINATGYMKVRIYTVGEPNTHSLLEDRLHWDITDPDTSPPVWSSAGTNNTVAGQPTLFHVEWTDDAGLSGFIFGTNNTGTWGNDTWTPMSGTTDWSNVTQTLNSTGGMVVQWRVWANDTSDNWNDTGTLALTTTQPPVASFTYSPITPYTGETVTFNASASYDTDGSIVDYFWTFGDGANGTGVITTHAYADNGVYATTLTVTDNDGLTGTDTQGITVLNRPPVASFTESETSVPTGTPIYFNASSSYDPDGYLASYFWDFGDGTNATGVTVEHPYADNGVYTVTLTVTDDDGAAATISDDKTVLNRPPVAGFTESATTVYTGEIIYFNATSCYDPDGTIVSYLWTFGDGTNSSGVTVNHAYGDNGVYTVTLTVTDDDDAIATSTETKTVLNRPPVASFTESATTVYKGEIIRFNASASYDPDGSVVSYFWTFGDDTNATGVTIDHSYANVGNYTVTLTITDDDGATASSAATKTVLDRPPVASFTESATIVLTGEVIAFNASDSYDPDGTIVSYTWNFGDGNITAVTSPLITHSYVDNGTYTVTLTVADNDGTTSSANAIKTVLNRAPVAVFTESATTVYTQETITFNASASYDLDGSIISYAWNFGDGNITTVTGPVITHAYADNGTYTVTLTVRDNDGATSSSSSIKTVWNRPPLAIFTESATTMFTSEVVAFNASGSYDQDGTLVSYFWTFGDGTNATGVTATHAYSENGVYTVTLTVTDNDGETGTATAVKTVLNRPPVASFTESATTVYTGVAIRFNASASYDPDGSINNFSWAFGDGINATGVVVDHAYSDNGTYTVTLTVTDNDGGTATATATKTVLNRAPVASFTESATTVLPGEVIYFNASASYDLDGTIASYIWAFGDGTNATGVLVSHAYVNKGMYVVTLTVTDDDGAIGSTSSTKTVLKPPVASFTYSPSVFRANETVTFDASASEPGFNGTHPVPIANYTWAFGDGNTTTASVPVIGHVYVVEGTYRVNLTVVCEDDPVLIQKGLTTNSTWQSLTVYRVTPHGPTASFTHSPLAPLVNEAVTFNASSSEPGWNGSALVPIASYAWDFGDGNMTTVTNPVVYHTYALNGTYRVNLTVVCEDDPVLIQKGLTTNSTRQDVTVYLKRVSVKPPSIVDIYKVNEGFRVEVYVENVTDLYVWGIGMTWDPTVLVCTAFTEGPFLKTGGTTSISEGTIDNTAGRIYPPYSCTLVYPAVVGVNGSGTLAYVDFRVKGYGKTWINLTVALYDSSFSIIPAGVQPGWFQLTMPPPRAPKASFTHSPPIVNVTVTFNASASEPGFNGTHSVPIANYTWNFGDGTGVTTVTDPVIRHTYTVVGPYTVSLTVTCADDPVLISRGLTQGTATSTVAVRERPLVYVKPPSIVDLYVAGEAFTVEVCVEGITDLYAWAIGISWDPAVLECTGLREGPFLRTGGGTLMVDGTVNDMIGKIYPPYSCTLRYPAKVGVNGSGTLAYVDFRVKGYGETWLNLTAETEMLDSMTPYPRVILVDLEPGWFRLSPPPEHDIDVTGMQAPDSIGTGVSTLINATVRNRGLRNESSVYVWFMVNDVLTDTATIPYLEIGAGVGVSFPWTAPQTAGTYNLTVYAVPVPGEGTTTDNYVYRFVTVKLLPVARFTYLPSNPVVGEAVAFNASESYDPDGTIVGYAWDFGDGTTGRGVTASHAYFPAGTYTVTLTVTDDRGDSNTASAGVTVTVAGLTLDVKVDVGSIHFRNETAEFFVLVSRLGEPVDAEIRATMYYANGTIHRNLTASVEHIATGLYRVPYTLSPNATKGTYVLVVEARLLTLKGISLRSFLLDPPADETSVPGVPTFSWWILGVVAAAGILVATAYLIRVRKLTT